MIMLSRRGMEGSLMGGRKLKMLGDRNWSDSMLSSSELSRTGVTPVFPMIASFTVNLCLSGISETDLFVKIDIDFLNQSYTMEMLVWSLYEMEDS